MGSRLFSIFIVALAVTEVLHAPVGATKPYRLKVLTLFYNPNSMHFGIARMLVDNVNNRTDILPDYEIELQVENDGGGPNAVPSVVSYIRNSKNDSEPYESPIIFGPPMSTSCKAIGPILPYINMVDLSSTCAAPLLASHARFRNLYLSVQTSQFTALAELRFMLDIGNWTRFALLTNAASVNDYGSALLMHQVAIDNKFTVLWFSMAVSVDDELLTSLKETDARVIVIFTADENIMFNFLCLAYKYGMTGPRYVFLANYGAYSDFTYKTYKSCPTNSIIVEQLKQTYWAGPAMNMENAALRSPFGHSQREFDRLLQGYMNSTTPAIDPMRYIHYDAILKGLYALDDTEKLLKRQNLSLRDYRRFPEQVMKVANDSLLNVKVAGLHIERMSYSSGTGLPDGEVQAIAHWSPSTNFENVAIGYQALNSPGYFLDTYFVKVIGQLSWLGGQPPRDHRDTRRYLHEVSNDVFIVVTVLAGGLFLCQVGVVSAFVKKIRNGGSLSQSLGFLGCFLMDGSAVCFVCGNRVTDSESRWIAAIALLVVGLSIIHGVLVMRAIVLKWTIQPKRVASTNPSNTARSHRVGNSRASIQPRGNGSASRISMTGPLIDWMAFDLTMCFGGIAFAITNIIVLISWFLADPIKCSLNFLGEPVYFESTDILITTFVEKCASANMEAWPLSLTFVNVLILIAGSWFSYVAKKSQTRQSSELTFIRFGLANSVTLLLAILLVVLVVRDTVSQQITIAFGTLANSALMSMAFCMIMIKTPPV